MADPGVGSPPQNPLELLGRWLAEAHASGAPAASAVAFVTVGAGGRPSARTVTLKRLDRDSLIAERDLLNQMQTVVSRQGTPTA